MTIDWPFDTEAELEAGISFHDEDARFLPAYPQKLHSWIENIIKREDCQLQQLTYIFCSDQYLHQINLEYLDHDTYTDIITFPYAEPPLIHSDIFISVERVRENADTLKVPFEQELHRVIIHGLLHLCGYPDKTEAEARQMRAKEDEALTLLDL
ncbi:MAG: rRNA maturation RNase YbeY [Phaeodactylibacter sp.]|uniref:rRNA maturation RNase YbeY n=1 Tax=Phaeodactylibacter sp. TaxID=1940289 RepID=UPI0032F09BFE